MTKKNKAKKRAYRKKILDELLRPKPKYKVFNEPFVSRIEHLTRQYLNHYFKDKKVHYNYRPDWLRNPLTYAVMELDIYYPKLNLAFEVSPPGFHNTRREKQRDEDKVRLCQENGVPLITIRLATDILKIKEQLQLEGDIPYTLYRKIIEYKPKIGSFTRKPQK